MISENSSSRQEMRGPRKFAYDVGVNVLANLVAAAILYLLGVLAGVLPSDPRLIGTAVVVLSAAAFYGLAFVVHFLRGDRKMQVAQWGLLAAGVFLISGAVTGIVNHDPLPRPATVAIGVLVMISSATNLWADRRLARRPQARASDAQQEDPPGS